MLSLQAMFTEKGWDTDYIAYAGVCVTVIVLVALFRYLGSEDGPAE